MTEASSPRPVPPVPPLPPVGLVGAGRAGTAIAAALRAAGVEVTGVVARSAASRRRAAERLPGVPVRELAAVAAGAGLVLAAVGDDALAGLAAELPRQAGLLVVHTSGRHGLAVLGPGPGRAAAHPCMTFPGGPADAGRLPGTTFGVTADDDAAGAAAALVAAVGGRVAWIAEADRPLYHAALANAANHLVTLVAQSADWLRAAGVADPYAALAPLAGAALGNVSGAGDAALTGPVARGDAGTVAAHLAALRAAGAAPEAVAAYAAMARLTAARARAAGLLDPSAQAAVLAVLRAVPDAGPDAGPGAGPPPVP